VRPLIPDYSQISVNNELLASHPDVTSGERVTAGESRLTKIQYFAQSAKYL